MAPKTILYLFLLTITLGCASSARLLDEADPQLPGVIPAPIVAPVTGPTTTLPSGQIPATVVAASEDPPLPVDADVAPIVPPEDDNEDVPLVAPVVPPTTATNAVPAPATAAPAGGTVAPPVIPPATVPGATNAVPAPATTAPAGPVSTGATAAIPDPEHPTLSFFMHDILGGSNPSARVVTGIIANSDLNGIPFSKTNNNFFPVNGGVPLANNNLKGIINSNNLPNLVGLNGAQQQGSAVLQNSGNNNVVNGGGNLPFVTAGQLPPGASLQKIMFGSTTVVDDELTEGHELGSGVIGRAQGFYMASSIDGTSQTVVLTAVLHGGEHEHVDDTISFFGVHRTASHESQVAVIGGTGKYEDASGYATIQTLNQVDQHTTDGTDTILEFNVYLF